MTHAAVGRSGQPLRLDRARRDAGLRPDRLLRRLPEAGRRQFARPGRALQVFLAVASPGSPRRIVLYRLAHTPAETALYVPFFKHVACRSAVGYIVLAYLVIVGTSNAVNLTDGLDGLAIMPAVMVAGALGVFAYLTGNTVFADYLQITASRRRRAAGVLRRDRRRRPRLPLVQHLSRAGLHGRHRRARARCRARLRRLHRPPGDRARS